MQFQQVHNFKRRQWTQAILNRFNQLSLDCLILHPETSIVAAVELDHSTHTLKGKPPGRYPQRSCVEVRRRSLDSMAISTKAATPPTLKAPYSDPSATTAPVSSMTPSQQTVSINSYVVTPVALGLEIGAHTLRATAATNALDHEADIAKVQEWLGHANIATT